MTPTDRAAARRACEAATAGPWVYDEPGNWRGIAALIRPRASSHRIAEIPIAGWRPKKQAVANGKFIALARTALPAALDALDAAETRIATLERRLAEAQRRIEQPNP